MRFLFWRRKWRNEELNEEIQGHLELAARENMESDLAQRDAQIAARREFGSIALAEEVTRDMWGGRWIEELLQDVLYAFRMLRKSPGFTAAAILTLALGVGANTAIFSIVNAVLLHSLPYRDPDRLVRVFFNEPGLGLRDVRFSKPELDDLQTRSGVFEDVTPIFEGSENLTGGEQPDRVEGLNASFSYFSMLGVTPQIGRLFGPQDFVPGFAPVVVISNGLWHRQYGADPHVVGRTIRVDTDPYTIIGVLPRGFRHPGPTVAGDVEVFGAGGFSADPFPPPIRGNRVLIHGIGRLKPGVTLGQAQARLTAMAAELRHDFPTNYPPQSQWTIEIQPLQETLVGKVRPMLLVLLGAVMLIVFIVSLNLANLLLARASGRQQETAVRLALGASRGRRTTRGALPSVRGVFLGASGPKPERLLPNGWQTRTERTSKLVPMGEKLNCPSAYAKTRRSTLLACCLIAQRTLACHLGDLKLYGFWQVLSDQVRGFTDEEGPIRKRIGPFCFWGERIEAQRRRERGEKTHGSVPLEGMISTLKSLVFSHELLDNEKNPEDQNKIHCGDANIHEYGNPLRGPRNKQNPQNMRNCDHCHSEPEPRLPPEFPFETDHYAKHANRNHKGPHPF